MKNVFVCLFMALAVTSNGLSLAKQSNLTAVYDGSGRKLLYVQRSDTGEKLLIESPLWVVATEGEGIINSADFHPLGAKNKTRSFKHEKSGLVCSVTSAAAGNFIRHFYTLEATKPVVVKQFVGLTLPPEFEPGGIVPGSPLINGNWFAGMEYPTARTIEQLENEIGTWHLSMLKPKEFKELAYSLPDKLVKTGDSLEIQFIDL